MQDVFNQDPFSFIQLTNTINNIDYQAGAIDTMLGWQERGVLSTTIAVQDIVKSAALIHSSERCGPRQSVETGQRNLRSLQIPHFAARRIITPCEIQGQLAQPDATTLRNTVSYVNEELGNMAWMLDATLTNLRLSAITGLIKDADGTTLLDIHNELGTTPAADINLAFGGLDASTFRTELNKAVQTIAPLFLGVNPTSWLIVAGDDWFNAAGELQDGSNGMFFTDTVCPYGSLLFGCYRIVNDSTFIAGAPAIATDEAFLLPLGIPNMYQTYYATADYWSTAQDVGRPRYARIFMDQEDRHVTLEVQTNPLPMISRPDIITKLIAI